MKKTMTILLSLAFVLILTAAVLLVLFVFRLSPEQSPAQPLEDYLAEHWKVFTLRSWDAKTGALELDYPLRFTYEQMKKYGGSMEELRNLPTGNLSTVESLRLGVREACEVQLRSVTVYGISSDGQLAYTVHPDGSITACWD